MATCAAPRSVGSRASNRQLTCASGSASSSSSAQDRPACTAVSAGRSCCWRLPAPRSCPVRLIASCSRSWRSPPPARCWRSAPRHVAGSRGSRCGCCSPPRRSCSLRRSPALRRSRSSLGRPPRYEGAVALPVYLGAFVAGARLLGPRRAPGSTAWLLDGLAVAALAIGIEAALEAAGLRPLLSNVSRPGSLLGNASDQGAWALLALGPLAAVAIRLRGALHRAGAVGAAVGADHLGLARRAGRGGRARRGSDRAERGPALRASRSSSVACWSWPGCWRCRRRATMSSAPPSSPGRPPPAARCCGARRSSWFAIIRCSGPARAVGWMRSRSTTTVATRPRSARRILPTALMTGCCRRPAPAASDSRASP